MKKHTDFELKSWHAGLMAVCTGVLVSNLYYNQPLVVLIAKEFDIPNSRAGEITFFTPLGYAIGLLFLGPLGDMLEKKKQIIITTGLTCLSLILAATATQFWILQLACVLIGITSVVPQLILPLAAAYAPENKRGKIIGTVMSGLLIGILLSRTVSGFVGEYIGWRAMFWIATGLTIVVILVMQLTFPKSAPKFKGTYGSLMKSLGQLFTAHPILREASFLTSLGFATFGMFWTTIVIFLAEAPFNYTSAKIGMLGIAAATGAIAAPVIGGIADKKNPRLAIGLGIILMMTSFAIYYLFSFSIIGIIIGVVLMDLGLQALHISNQSRVYALLPEARNRLNTVYMTICFCGTSVGALLGLFAWNLYKWPGVCAMGASLMLVALVIYMMTYQGAVSKELDEKRSHSM